MNSCVAVDVSIILVGLNAKDFVQGCVSSLEKAQWRGITYDCIYIDNGSTDGSARMMAEQFPWVRLVENPSNVGYCPAANQGARLSRARYLYLLNDDTLVLDDAIALLVETMDLTPQCGTIGSRLLYPDGTEQWSGRRFPTLLYSLFGRKSAIAARFPNFKPVREYLCKDQLAAGEPFEVDWVSAAGQIVRREAFDQVGGLAEDYYYWHETVFCDRLKAAGYSVMLHPGSKVIHYEGMGSGPRPYPVQRFHIINFNQGAYRCYCEHYKLGFWSIRRFAAAAMLAGRAATQLLAARLCNLH